MDARVVQEAAGPGPLPARLRDLEDLPQQRADGRRSKTLGTDARRGRDRARRARRRGVRVRRARPGAPPCRRSSGRAETPREVPPVYVAATAPKMQALAGEIADGCLTPSITTPAFVALHARERRPADIDIGCTIVASIHEDDRDAGRDGAREIAGMYLANKVQNIQGAADTLLDLAGIEQDEIRPVAEAMERGGRLAAKAQVTDALLDKCKPIAGTPEDCIAAIEEYRDAGCTHVMLELWGDRAARADPALRRAGAAALARMSRRRRRRLVELALRRRRRSRASPARSRRWPSWIARRAARARPLGAVAAGRGRPRERARHLGGRRRRQDADVQRPPGHVVLGAGAVARRASRASSRQGSSATAASTGSASRT